MAIQNSDYLNRRSAFPVEGSRNWVGEGSVFLYDFHLGVVDDLTWEAVVSQYWDQKEEYILLEEATPEQEEWFLQSKYSESVKNRLLDKGKIRALVRKPNPDWETALSQGVIKTRSLNTGGRHGDRAGKYTGSAKVPKWVYEKLGVPYVGVPKPVKKR